MSGHTQMTESPWRHETMKHESIDDSAFDSYFFWLAENPFSFVPN